MVDIPYGKPKSAAGSGPQRTMPWCPEHGIRLHSSTFAYWNGPGMEDESRLRNFIVRDDLVRAIALRKGMKAESHRLGNEMSEDALSWNVFVSLAQAKKLRDVARFLTGRNLDAEPKLYLWGRQIDLVHGDHSAFEPLLRVRKSLESDIHPFVTEPDIMLVAEDEMIICIEAKFGSGNPLAHASVVKEGEKPTARAALLTRYLGVATGALTRKVVRPNEMGERLHSQLFRNVVFAAEMAEEVPWHMVNLVSSTQRGANNDARYSSADPTGEVRQYLHPDWQHCFTYRTWEEIHADVVAGDSVLAKLDGYLRGKSAHYKPAFHLG